MNASYLATFHHAPGTDVEALIYLAEAIAAPTPHLAVIASLSDQRSTRVTLRVYAVDLPECFGILGQGASRAMGVSPLPPGSTMSVEVVRENGTPG